MRSCCAGFCIHAWILAWTDAADRIFLKAWMVPIIRSCFVETFYSADTDGFADLGSRTSTTDQTAMLETIRQEYIRTAKAKGASSKRVIWKHALRNALLPVVTALGTGFGASLGGAIIAETVFAMPGMGTLMTTAIRQKDIPMVMGATLFLAVLFSFVILLVDILYAFIDPRIKAKYQNGGKHHE